MDRPCVAVVGGGISGLSAALRLAERRPDIDVRLLEARPHLGGVLETIRQDGFLVEAAADSFLTNPPAAVDLCRRVGIADSLIETPASRRGVYVVRKGRLARLPDGFASMAPTRVWPLLATRVLSFRGKLRMALEYFRRAKRAGDDESIADFFTRRFGHEAYERLLQPLVGAVYGGDAARLSIDAALPQLAQMEQQHGGLIRAALARRRATAAPGAAPRGPFVALQAGMARLVQSAADRLPPSSIRLGAPVDRVLPSENGKWLLKIGGAIRSAIEADGVIVAAPAYVAGRLLKGVDGALAQELSAIEYAGCVVVSLGYHRSQVAHRLNGAGFVVPLAEQRTILSCSFSSEKFPGRAPEGSVLLRVFIGGARQSGLLQLPRRQLADLAEQEIADLLHVVGAPQFRHVVRHERAMPQYHLGHLNRLATISARLAALPGLALAGNAYGAVGVPGCIASGDAAADGIVAHLSAKPNWEKAIQSSSPPHAELSAR
jgi:oxygen-dependent protoporphyrinogen oxidase